MDIDTVLDDLRRKGLRMTQLKKQVVGLFLGGACGLSAREVLERVPESPHISTVHRCLRSLEGAGFLRPYRNEGGVMRYRCSGHYYPDHGHFLCFECGRRIAVEYILPEEFVRFLERTSDISVDGSDLLLEGRCGVCLSKD